MRRLRNVGFSLAALDRATEAGGRCGERAVGSVFWSTVSNEIGVVPINMSPPRKTRVVVLRVIRIAAYAWAGIYTLLGLVIGLVALLSGATARSQCGIIEIGGGFLGRCVSRFCPPFAFSAITLGHVVIGVDHATLACVRPHELVHVRQYERWGPLFVPLYLMSSFVQLVRGRRPYLDNTFEREARDGMSQSIASRRDA